MTPLSDNGQLALDPRTIAAFDLERAIARGEPLSAIGVSCEYDELVSDPWAPAPAECSLSIHHYAIAGVQLHPRRRATRVMTIKVRGLVVWRATVCGHCGLADYVVVTRAQLRDLGQL